MLPSSSSRHTRRAFFGETRASGIAEILAMNCGDVATIAEQCFELPEPVASDVSLEPVHQAVASVNPFALRIDRDALLISALSRQIVDDDSSLNQIEDDRCTVRAVLERLDAAYTRAISAEHEELLARMRRFAEESSDDFDGELLDFTPAQESVEVECDVLFERPAHSRMQVHIELLPNGGRVESFSNGSMLTKDGLGRVVEVRSTYGDCLFLEYSGFGHLEAFTRTDSKGFLHSFGKRDKHGVAVRDAEGRVRAAGESMTIDHRGCFYLHTLDGQYFLLDLVTGTHCERRKIFRSDGRVDFLTGIFAHDGFRMANMYAVNGGIGTRYRFYGRDGTIVEFLSEEDIKSCRPVAACAPASKPVDKTWLKRAQARTAWESVYDYLARVS